MFRLNSFGVFLVSVSIVLLASCSGGNPVNETLPTEAVEAVTTMGFGDLSAADLADFPPIPVETEADNAYTKSSSWLLNIDPQIPILENRTNPCAIHPDCLVMQALYDMPVTHLPPGPYFAYALYQIPVGASASDLLTLSIDGSVVAAGEKYYLALANYTAMAWQFYGPGTADYSFDMASLGYNFTSGMGNMYLLVAVPRYSTYHLWDITLDFNSDEPTFWNVWGEANNHIPIGAVPTPMPGETVTFEDLGTGTIYNTVTAANGHWGATLPTGTYKFTVTNQDVLFDTAAHQPIELLDVVLEIYLGDIIYHGPNAAYDGTIVGSPIITTNDF